jgi:DNA (cytosine-5)-methyltransferase 1
MWPAVLILHPYTCDHSQPITGVYGHSRGRAGAYHTMLPDSTAQWRRAMAIEWMQDDELTQAIPPAYTEFIGRQLLEAVA